jgi:excisionase family DNA binding protein
MGKEYLTTEEAAARLGVTVGRVRQMIVDGSLPTERFGRAHMISNAALKEAQGRKTTPGPTPKVEAKVGGKKSKRPRA